MGTLEQKCISICDVSVHILRIYGNSSISDIISDITSTCLMPLLLKVASSQASTSPDHAVHYNELAYFTFSHVQLVISTSLFPSSFT